MVILACRTSVHSPIPHFERGAVLTSAFTFIHGRFGAKSPKYPSLGRRARFRRK
jgi:hypothetical protein